jgi:hypothetical protein
MPTKTITFLYLEPLLQRGDAIEIRFHFSLIDTSLVDTPEEPKEISYHTIVVKMSRSRQAMWNLQPAQLKKIMYEYGKRHLDRLVADGKVAVSEMLNLSTSTTPRECPYDPSRITMTPGRSYEVTVKG